MPSGPGSTFELIVILVFLLPGVVFQFVRGRLRGPEPDDSSATSRVLRALTASTLLAITYAFVVGPSLTRLVAVATTAGNTVTSAYVRQVAAWALVLLFVVPAALAGLDYLSRLGRTRWGWPNLRLAYDPTPSAWDFAFTDIEPMYLRILLQDGKWVGGWFGANSFVSSYPEPHDLFIEQAHYLSETGVIGDVVEGNAGLWVPCNEIVLIEFLPGGT